MPDNTRVPNFARKGGRAIKMVPEPGEMEAMREELDAFQIVSMADAMDLARVRARDPKYRKENYVYEEEDPDPYGFGQELEESLGIDILGPKWKAQPDDQLWVKRLKGRARKAAVTRLFLHGFPVSEIAQRCKVSEKMVQGDLVNVGREWRRTYLSEMEELAAKDLARFDYYLSKLAPAVDRGDTKAILAAVDIIKERGNILGYRAGMNIDIESYVREVASANGYDPEKAVVIAQKIAINMRAIS